MTASRKRSALPLWAVAAALALTPPVPPSPLQAQQTGTIRGAVVEEGSWELIGSAKVAVVGTDLETRTEGDGTFLIAGVPLGRVFVRVEAAGFPAVVEEVEVTPGDVPLAVFLQTAMAALEGIIVFGKRAAPTRVGVNKTAADLVAEKVPTIRPILARATDSRTAPTTFTIRGRNTFGNSAGEPLIIVDGVRMPGGIGSAMRTLRQIAAQDVASIQVLKGASSAFVYGAPDGVILIETASRAPER
jgi:hypothetical protein